MNIKADSDVFYLIPYIKKIMINLQKKKETSLCHKKDRRCHCLLLWEASLTVEASFSATAFFLVLFSLLTLFQMMFTLHTVQFSLADTVWQYETMGTKLGTVNGVLENQVLIQWNEKDEICFVWHREKIPFIGSSLAGISFYQQMKINDYKGRSMVPDRSAAKEYVFIAENGRVYHKKRNCVYLNPDIQGVRYQRVAVLRNESGSRYKSCKSCCRKKTPESGETVYITSYGECFHMNKLCSGLRRTVRRVELDKVGSMPPCSKCAEH